MQNRWTEQEARGLLEQYRSSGLSIERFATEQGLSSKRLYWWRMRLEGPSKKVARRKSAPVTLVAVQVKQAESSNEALAVLLRSGQVVKVGRGFDAESLRRVVAVLEGA